jgi:hypothetical protein
MGQAQNANGVCGTSLSTDQLRVKHPPRIWGVLYADLVGTDQAPHTPRRMVWAGPVFPFTFSLFFRFFPFLFLSFLFTFLKAKNIYNAKFYNFV